MVRTNPLERQLHGHMALTKLACHAQGKALSVLVPRQQACAEERQGRDSGLMLNYQASGGASMRILLDGPPVALSHPTSGGLPYMSPMDLIAPLVTTLQIIDVPKDPKKTVLIFLVLDRDPLALGGDGLVFRGLQEVQLVDGRAGCRVSGVH